MTRVIIANPAKKEVKIKKVPVSVLTKGGSTELYSLLFPKSDWGKEDAANWVKSRNFKGTWEQSKDNNRFLIAGSHNKSKNKKPLGYRYGKKSEAWYHNGKKIIPLFVIEEKKEAEAKVADYVSIKRDIKVTPAVIEYIRKNKDTKNSILQSELKNKLNTKLSTSTIYRIKKGVYNIKNTPKKNPSKQTKTKKEVVMTRNPFVGVFGKLLRKNPSVIEYAMRNPGIALFKGGKARSDIKTPMISVLQAGANTNEIATLLTEAAQMNGLKGTIQPSTVKKYLKSIYPSLSASQKKLVNYSMGYRTGTFLGRGAAGRSSAAAKKGRDQISKAAKAARAKYLVKGGGANGQDVVDWKGAAADTALLNSVGATGKKYIKSMASRQVHTYRVSAKRAYGELPNRGKPIKGKRGGRTYGKRWDFSGTAPKLTEAEYKARAKKAAATRAAHKKAALATSDYVEDYPIDDYIDDYIESAVGAGISGNQLIDTALDFLNDVIAGSGTLWLDVGVNKGVSALIAQVPSLQSNEEAAKKVAKGGTGLITYLLGIALEKYADNNLSDEAEIIAKNSAKAMKVVSTLYAASAFSFNGKKIVPIGEIVGGNPSPVNSSVRFEYEVPPNRVSDVVVEELHPVGSVVKEEEIPMQSNVGDYVLEELEQI